MFPCIRSISPWITDSKVGARLWTSSHLAQSAVLTIAFSLSSLIMMTDSSVENGAVKTLAIIPSTAPIAVRRIAAGASLPTAVVKQTLAPARTAATA
jgi:hypothetical protein